jgi:hypothetical protein
VLLVQAQGPDRRQHGCSFPSSFTIETLIITSIVMVLLYYFLASTHKNMMKLSSERLQTRQHVSVLLLRVAQILLNKKAHESKFVGFFDESW